MNKLEIRYQEHDLNDIIDYFVHGFHGKVASHEYFIDTDKGKAVIKLYMEESEL